MLKSSLVNPSISFQDMINSLNILFTLKEFDATIEDEFHTYVADYSYKSDVIDKVSKFSDFNDTRLLLSGTVNELPRSRADEVSKQR